jgi:hypothetical protein
MVPRRSRFRRRVVSGAVVVVIAAVCIGGRPWRDATAPAPDAAVPTASFLEVAVALLNLPLTVCCLWLARACRPGIERPARPGRLTGAEEACP